MTAVGPVIRDDLFERLEFPDAAEYRARVDLAFAIVDTCNRRRFGEMDAARLLRIDPREYSQLANARVDGFSRQCLEQILDRLNLPESS